MKKGCWVCGKSTTAHGLCQKHYMQERRGRTVGKDREPTEQVSFRAPVGTNELVDELAKRARLTRSGWYRASILAQLMRVPWASKE